MAAERRRAAGLDRRHDLELGKAQVTGVGLSPAGPLSAKDVGDLDRGAQAGSGAALLTLQRRQPFQRTVDVADRVDGDAGVERGRLQFACPSNTWITRMSTSCSSRWVAKLWRSVWGDTRLEIQPLWRRWMARLICRVEIGSHGCGRGTASHAAADAASLPSFHHCRNSASSCGDSMTLRSFAPCLARRGSSSARCRYRPP